MNRRIASPDTEPWIASMAKIMGLREVEDDGSIHVHFIRKLSPLRLHASSFFRLDRLPSEQLSAKLNLRPEAGRCVIGVLSESGRTGKFTISFANSVPK